MQIPWGPLEATGTMVAAAIATVTFKYVAAARRRDLRQAEHNAEEDVRRLARLVTVHLDSTPNVHYIDDHQPRMITTDDVEPEYEQVPVLVANHSAEPIHSAMVFVPGRTSPLHVGTVNPGQSHGKVWMDAPLMWHVMNVGCGGPAVRNYIDLEVVFTDNRRRRWRRNGEGEPVQLLASDDVEADWKVRQFARAEETRRANVALGWDPEVLLEEDRRRGLA